MTTTFDQHPQPTVANGETACGATHDIGGLRYVCNRAPHDPFSDHRGQRGPATEPVWWDGSSPDDPAVPPPAGPVEASVRRDIAAMGDLTSGVRATMATMAYGLAHQLDRAHADAATTPAMVAAINKELRATLAEVVKTQNDNTRRNRLSDILSRADFETEMPPDLGDQAEPQAPDDGPEAGPGGAHSG